MEQTVPSQPLGTCILGGGSHVPGARTDKAATAPEGSNTIADNSAVATDAGRSVSGTGIPAGAFVGQVTDTPVTATAPNQKGDSVDTGSFTLVNAYGEPLASTAAVSGVTLGARTPATDPLYNSTDPTTGGGDTGSVLISPYITPGSVSTVYYLSAGAGHLALSIQGEAIAVHLAGGGVSATVVGPEVPEEGRFPVPTTSPVSFVLTFAQTSGKVPLRTADLELVDGDGDVHHPVVTALHGGSLPARVPPGKPFSVRLRGVLPTGDGAVEWKPAPGRPLAGWAFTVEID